MAPLPAPTLKNACLLDLDDARARDPRVTGAKAATLARARAAGLPCLPGWVVPVAAGRDPLRRGAVALESGGSGQARLTVMATAPDGGLLDELAGRVRASNGPVVVRSSSVAEEDPAWAGAFSSFAGVAAGEVATAVAGVWASAFTIDALQRSAALGTPLAGGGLAVLVQPELASGPGGSARLLAGGAVEVAAIRGLPDRSVGLSQRGLRAAVDVSGRARGSAADVLGAGVVSAVAELARRVRAVLGLDLIEWGWADGSAVLLQARRAARPASGGAPVAPPPPALATPQAKGVAALAARFPGPLGEALVLPWALGCTALPTPEPACEPVADAIGVLSRAVLLADELTARAWGMPARQARQQSSRLLARIRGPDPDRGLAHLAHLEPVDEDRGRRVVTMVQGVGAAMSGAGLLPAAGQVWRHDPEGLARILAEEVPPPGVRIGPDRWEPFLYHVLAAQGEMTTGVAATPGVGAGPVRVMDHSGEARFGGSREVLVARQPVAEMASLLWSAAGLVTGPGDPSAHLFEVAACLGVPAVIDAEVDGLCSAAGRGLGMIAAVDGASGTVWSLDLDIENPATVRHYAHPR